MVELDAAALAVERLVVMYDPQRFCLRLVVCREPGAFHPYIRRYAVALLAELGVGLRFAPGGCARAAADAYFDGGDHSVQTRLNALHAEKRQRRLNLGEERKTVIEAETIADG